MAPETRSSSSRKNKSSPTHGLEPDRELNKRQKRPQSHHSGEIVPGRSVDLDFFTQERFNFFEWLKDMNWVSFVCMKQKFYPELVRQFYGNLTYDADKTQICSYVKGKEIRLNHKLLKTILGIPNVGTEIYENNDNKWVDDDAGVSRVEALRTILDNPDVSQVSKVNACQLNLETKLLHHMVVHIILPRKTSFNCVLSMDLLVMFHVLKGKPFNLPFVVLSHMIARSEKRNGCLPYGMILTSIFKHFKVSLEEEEGEELKCSNVYNEATLHKMGYVKSERGWFLKKDKVVVQQRSEILSHENLDVNEIQYASLPSASPDSTALQTSLCANTSMSLPNPASSASPCPNCVLAVEEGQCSEEARQPSMIEGIFLLVRGMKEDMKTMTMNSNLDELQRKIEHLRSLVSLLRSQGQEKTVGDIFLLLELIMADVRSLRTKIENFGNRIDYLHSQLIEFLRQRQDLVKADRESMEWMIVETDAFRGQNEDIICRFETISTEIQDFWDCLSSRTG